MASYNAKNLTGKRFGRLKVISQAPTENQRTMWNCLCDCGNKKVLPCYVLTRGLVRSCGCLQKDTARKLKTKHGGKNTRLYNIWRDMKERCYNPQNPSYIYYGNKNVSICNEWLNDFGKFRCWAKENGYAKNLTIDRIDVDGDYCPENCRWTDMFTQENNRTNNIKIFYNGKEYTLLQLSQISVVSYKTLHQRLFMYKWDVEKAVTTPSRIKKRNKKKGDNKYGTK